MNFVQSTHKLTWNIQLNELRQFKHMCGHAVVVRHHEQFPKLGSWVNHKRDAKKKLTKQQLEDLNKLNFVQNPCEAQWFEKFNELKNFKEKYRHAKVTPSMNKELAAQIVMQRRECKREDRRRQLDSIGFVWDHLEALEAQWFEKFNELRDFKKKYG